MYVAELLGGPLDKKNYSVSYPYFASELRFLEQGNAFRLSPHATIVYKRFLANLYIYDRREEHDNIDSDTNV
jgi:hypothetical protein